MAAFLIILFFSLFSDSLRPSTKTDFHYLDSNVFIYNPKFPGGQDNLTAFIKRNLQWPPSGIYAEGKVIVELTINSSGYIKEIKIVKSLAPHFDNEVLKVINILPQWIPTTDSHGNNIESMVTIPFTFSLLPPGDLFDKDESCN